MGFYEIEPSCNSFSLDYSRSAIIMELPPTVKEYKILETAEDIQERRRQVLQRYQEFKEATKRKREKLEDSRRFLYFQRDASELESWIKEKMQVAGDESYRDPTNLQAKIQKHQGRNSIDIFKLSGNF